MEVLEVKTLRIEKIKVLDSKKKSLKKVIGVWLGVRWWESGLVIINGKSVSYLVT